MLFRGRYQGFDPPTQRPHGHQIPPKPLIFISFIRCFSLIDSDAGFELQSYTKNNHPPKIRLPDEHCLVHLALEICGNLRYLQVTVETTLPSLPQL